MSRYAIIDPNGNVLNVIVWDGASDWSHPDGTTLVQHDDAVCPGWIYIDGKFQPPQVTE